MPHADSSLVPPEITSKAEFWIHVRNQLAYLLENQRHWVSNLANASSLIYNSLLAFSPHFGNGNRAVNWCGFYLDSSVFPQPRFAGRNPSTAATNQNTLLLGPFCGKPACQFINVSPDRARGVCAHAFLRQKSVIVPDVEEFPSHIACDGETKSEIVCPLVLQDGNHEVVLGVLDLDCLTLGGFDEQDKLGLEAITHLIVEKCDW